MGPWHGSDRGFKSHPVHHLKTEYDNYVVVDLFVDIMTVPDVNSDDYSHTTQAIQAGELGTDSDKYWKYMHGALRYTHGRVILITYRINDLPVLYLKEWEKGERGILKKFYLLVQDLQRYKKKNPLHIIGHNILSFDMFFMYNRMRIHDIDDEYWLQYWFMNGPLIMDLLQVHLPINGMSAVGLKHQILAHAYGLASESDTDKNMTQCYFSGEYDEILQYSRRAFVYPDMFRMITTGNMISSERLAASMDWHNSNLS